MQALLKRYLAVAGLTALEVVRQPILLLLATTCVVFVSLLPALLMHVLGDSQKLVQDSALATHFVFGLLLAVYAASSALGSELRRGTLNTVLSKPVERELFFLAKFTGIAVVLILFSVATGIATTLSARMAEEAYVLDWKAGGPLLAAPFLAYIVAGLINYYRQRPFVSNAFGLLVVFLVGALLVARLTGAISWRLVPASLLITLAALLLAAVALALVTRLELVPTLAVCTVIFLVGLMTDYLLGRAAATNPVAAFAYDVLPNWQHFWLADALAGDGAIPWRYVGRVAVYAIFYLLGTLSLGMLAFRNVETKA